ncbi:APC membrane recruitment protein 1 [Hyla sarda]|uniref:APC membrane recruitment protein 1 n=1 Tax=Hyla sarda TaxID=327740 RepID=UPI0024C3B522|nr:APC membrane recruitment protein 1 [Hyla sarda]
MEARHSCQEETPAIKSSSSVCERLVEVPHDEDTAKVEILPVLTGSCVDQQTGKQKKNPFKFFGGRRSICTLPSFFGGKNKGLGKGNSRKSVSKSKTHDGISDVHMENEKGYLDNTIGRAHRGDLSTLGGTLSSSHSADSGITSPVKLDFNYHDISPMGSTECFEKKLNGDKSFSFPRPKKGLKGLFSSIRRHKKNKTHDPEKCERYDHITQRVILEQLNRYPSEDDGLQDNSEQPKISSLHSDISTESSLNVTVECEKEELPICSVSMPDIAPHKADELLVEPNEVPSEDQNNVIDSKPDDFDCSDPKAAFTHSGKSDSVDRESLPSAGDQLSLMFDDVSSLKSFDSLIGCGDIIAEQDIDNISDNSISVERSREATKRSSCLVTYQGGGEEMATPDDLEEEYLQQLLGSSHEADASYGMEDDKEHDNMSKCFTELKPNAYAMAAEDAFVDRSVLSNTELLTPQSDQQESAPNSDEGYYDSTTPGPDDYGGEGFSQKERLPRDSYSGDALYEFYEPDESLISPAPGGESLYESKQICSETFDQFFDFCLPLDSGLIQKAERKEGATETEEERLAVIQKQLLFWEKQREAAMKGMDHLGKDIFSKEKQNMECEVRTASLPGKNKSCLIREKYILPNVNKDGADKGIQHAQPEKLGWKDFTESSLTDTIKQEGYIQDLKGNSFVEDSAFELNVASLGTRDQNVTRMTNVTKLSNQNVTPVNHIQNVFDSDFSSVSGYSQENECGQAVNFSQTLVEFAKNGMLFSSISKKLGSTGSSSSFHHDLSSLPTMVTFDIVDVENEGECEQQLDLSPDEDISPFDGFDHSCVQESLAECDEQLLQMDSHHSFQSYNWGVTSLPRHLDQYKLSPSGPVPLSLNRRSKSLDTDSLDLELGALHMPKSGLKSYDDLVPWKDRKNSWRCEVSCTPREGSSYNRCNILEQIVPPIGQFETYAPVLPMKQGYSREPQGSSSSNQLPVNTRQMANPTDLLQCNTRQSQEGFISFRYPTENTTKKLARVPPLEEQREVNVDYSYDYHTPQKQTRVKPVGITQAMPQQQKHEDFDSFSDYLERSGPTKKGNLDFRASSTNDWSNSYSECPNS